MSKEKKISEEAHEDGKVDLERREVLSSIAKYTATVVGASAVVLSASSSVAHASVSGAKPDKKARYYNKHLRRKIRKRIRHRMMMRWFQKF